MRTGWGWRHGGGPRRLQHARLGPGQLKVVNSGPADLGGAADGDPTELNEI